MSIPESPVIPPDIRSELSERIGSDLAGALCAYLEYEVALRDKDLAETSFKAGLRCAFGPAWGEFLYAELTNRVEGSNAAFAREQGITRAAVSKRVNTCRRHLNWPLRVPANARAGAKAKGTATPARNDDSAKSL